MCEFNGALFFEYSISYSQRDSSVAMLTQNDTAGLALLLCATYRSLFPQRRVWEAAPYEYR